VPSVRVAPPCLGQRCVLERVDLHVAAVGVDAVVLSKYDSSGKGGIVVAVSRELGLPFAFFGTGERPQDFQAFDVETFLNGLLGDE